jgi:ADP-dependent NAD(P)H-hydrate dehydratase / NAD(P)H-hydrate epimerase
MRGAWRAADVRAAEQVLIDRIPEGALMQRAAAGLARRCAQLLADAAGGGYGRSVLLLVGAGNNGGDTLFAGARLARRGIRVSAMLTAPDRAHPAGLVALRRAGGLLVDRIPSTVELVVDGILGIGARGGLASPVADLVAAATSGRGQNPIVVSVDLPSGVVVDTGAVDGPAVRADVTVTFGCLKPALVVGPAAPLAGQLDLVDIGLPAWLDPPPATCLPDAADVAAWWPSRGAFSDKYSRGVVGVSAGSTAFPGAALLAVAGALAGPVGMVRYAGPQGDAVSRAYPSVVVAPEVPAGGRVQAWVCGCGLGTDQRAVDELRAVLAAPVPVVLDADALTLAADADLPHRIRDRAAPTVLTPHDREFARLAGGPPGADRIAAVVELARRLRATVLLKGDRSIVAAPDGPVWANPTGTPALATAGSGDLLAGLLGALLAGGLPADRAAITAAFLHGLAGQAAVHALGGGRAPVTATGVGAALPAVIASLTAGDGRVSG